MQIRLMYITNRPEVARIAEDAGTDRIFVDLEQIWKAERQGGMDTVQSRHSVADIRRVRKTIKKAELLVRCNPVHQGISGYPDTKEEIEQILDAGADIVMLPFFKRREEVEAFLSAVDGRCRTMLLFETPEAAEHVEEFLELKGIDEAFIGLNDLSLGYHKKFMFELLSDGTVERISGHFKAKGIPFGFGGIAAIGEGTLPSEMILKEHIRLGSSAVILSRSFCRCSEESDLKKVRERFTRGIEALRNKEKEVRGAGEDLEENRRHLEEIVGRIVHSIEAGE